MNDRTAATSAEAGTLGSTTSVVWAVAVLAALAALLSRGLEPALPGVWVGINHIIHGVKLAAAVSSQFFAICASALVFGLVFASVRSTLPSYLRGFVVGVGVLVVLAVMVSSATRLPQVSSLFVATSAALLSLLTMRLSARFINLRAASLVVAAMAMAGTLRVLAIVAASLAVSSGGEWLQLMARAVATGVSLMEAVGVATALAWLWLRPGAARSSSIVALALVVVGAGLALYVAHLGDDPEAGGMALLIARAVRKLQLAPAPYTPYLLRSFVELLGWFAALAVLVVPRRARLMGAALSLALVARGNLELPLCAVALVIAALVLAHHPGPDLRREIDLLERNREKLAKARSQADEG